jgi:hypothetical protein
LSGNRASGRGDAIAICRCLRTSAQVGGVVPTCGHQRLMPEGSKDQQENRVWLRGVGAKKIHFFGGPPGSRNFFSRGVAGCCLSRIHPNCQLCFFVAHTKLTVWLCLAKLTPPNTPDTPCLQVIRVHCVDVPSGEFQGSHWSERPSHPHERPRTQGQDQASHHQHQQSV